MSEFPSASDRIDDAMRTTTIATCREKGWRIVLVCKACGYGGKSGGEIAWSDLPNYPADLTLATLEERATFSRCGHKGAWIDQRQDPAARNAQGGA